MLNDKTISNRVIKKALFAICLFAGNAIAVDIYQADKLFDDEQYSLAFSHYNESAAIGNPHAHFRLGIMYHNGLAPERNSLRAMYHLHMASEYGHEGAKKHLQTLLSYFDNEQRIKIESLLFDFSKQHSDEKLISQYYPVLDTDAVKEIEPKALFNSFIRKKGGVTLKLRDCEIEKDGSWRNFITLLSFTREGKTSPFSYRNRLLKPHPNHRLSNCNYGKPLGHRDLPQELERMRDYAMIRRHRDSVKDQFELSMVLALNPTLERSENEGMRLMEHAADKHYPMAAYMIGRHYFYPGHDLEKGLRYLSLAAQYNYPTAEYRLGRILTDHPYVIKDEKKALFWFESAASKKVVPAMIKAAELRLLANDPSLLNIEKALNWLDKVPFTEKTNPEYQFLLALTYKNNESPNWRQFFRHLEKAIHNGRMAGWDVSDWQILYDKYINGNISVIDNV